MNASLSIPTAPAFAALKADRFGSALLLINGVVLSAVASASVLFDLAGHFLGVGPFAMYEGNLDSIAFVEAHGFALIVALHGMTIFTWSTAYTLDFPAFYPLVALVYLSLIGLFAVTRRFEPARAK